MFKSEKTLEKTIENLKRLEMLSDNPKQFNLLLVEKFIASGQTYRYIMDSRLGIIYIHFQEGKNRIQICVNESKRGFFVPFFLVLMGFFSLLLSKIDVSAILFGTGLMYFYILYVNFKHAKKSIHDIFN